MKKSLVFLFVLLAFSACLFAQTNSQKIYSVDSELYSSILKLYVATGHALPSTTGPWSADELAKMVDRLSPEDVPQYLAETYEEVCGELSAEADLEFNGGAMSLNGKLELDSYIHTYNGTSIERTDVDGFREKAYEGRSWWYGKDLNKVDPFVSLDWEAFLGDKFYSLFNISLQNSCHAEEELGSTRLNFNIPVFQNAKFNLRLLDVNFPSRAFFAFGGDGWSAEIGRDRINWGAGSIGNLVISDNVPYYDMARFTAYSDSFKYSYILAFFANKMNYYDNEQPGYCGTGHNDSTSTLRGVYFYTAHRFEGRLLEDRLSLAFTEALVYQSETSSIQFTALSPMYFMHNAYMPNNSNSTLEFEANFTVANGLNIYGEFLLDQFAFPGFEKSPGPGKDNDCTTNGVAVLLGAKYVTGLEGGILTVNPEFAFVSPYSYVRDGETSSYGMDYVASVRSRLYSYEDRGLGTDIVYDEYPIGYKYGPDCLVASLDAEYKLEKLTLGAGIFAMRHGTNDIWTKWRDVPANTSEEDYKAQFKAPTSEGTDNYRYADASARNAVWSTFDIGLSASYMVFDDLELSCCLDYVLMKNIFNLSGNDANDLQVIIGVKYGF